MVGSDKQAAKTQQVVFCVTIFFSFTPEKVHQLKNKCVKGKMWLRKEIFFGIYFPA